MATNLHREVMEWLEAEGGGAPGDADERFRAVCRGLDRLEAPAGFAGAVMARLAAVAVVRDAYASWWVRAAVAASVLLVGGAAALVPWPVWMDALLGSIQAVALGFGRLLAGGQAWVAGGLALWAGLAGASAVVGRQLLGPGPLLFLALNLAVAACALGALRRLMALQEN